MRKGICKKVAVVGMIIANLCVCSYLETTYTREAKVIKVSEDEIILVEDTTGNLWEFYGSDLSVGDKIRLIMDDRHTTDIHDDVIKDIKEIKD